MAVFPYITRKTRMVGFATLLACTLVTFILYARLIAKIKLRGGNVAEDADFVLGREIVPSDGSRLPQAPNIIVAQEHHSELAAHNKGRLTAKFDGERISDIRDAVYDKAKTTKYQEQMSKLEFRYSNPYGDSKVNRSVLAFLLPHSHQDPGWLWTFDTYYSVRSRSTLDTMIVKLMEYPDMKFQWTESIYLARWYAEQNEATRQRLRDLIAQGRLEINHGGWTMPDEASTTLYSLVENLILGHGWVKQELGVVPEYSWANDPFGHSSTLAYLLKEAGIKGMVINRIDMLLKKELRETERLEFQWRQMFDRFRSDSDMLTHILPHELYNTADMIAQKNEHGKMFDFLDQSMSVREDNIDLYAQTLAVMLHKRSSYYKHGVMFIPIGDDFRYIDSFEYDAVHMYWSKLMAHFRVHPEFGVQLQFGTLKDYFSEISNLNITFPVLAGDFFPYCDKNDIPKYEFTYWTGYFTTRPSFKAGIRTLEQLTRQAEILYSFSVMATQGEPPLNSESLQRVRETLSWLLHHDAITGTSPQLTISDYLSHMRLATTSIVQFSIQSMRVLSNGSASVPQGPAAYQDVQVFMPQPNVLIANAGQLPEQTLTVEVGSPHHVTLFNSVAQRVHTVVHFFIKVPVGAHVQVLDSFGKYTLCQLNPVFVKKQGVSSELMELAFEAQIPALGLRNYTIAIMNRSLSAARTACIAATVHIYDNKNGEKRFEDIGNMENFQTVFMPREPHTVITMSSETVTARVAAINGSLIALQAKGKSAVVHLGFAAYNTKNTSDARTVTSENGHYMFTAYKERSIPYSNNLATVVLMKGPVESCLLSTLRHVTQTIRINDVEQGVSVQNKVTWVTQGDLVMTINSDIKNGARFYTDSNAFSIVKRERRNKIVSANYYPITSAIYIEDESRRLTLLPAQSLGGSSLAQGHMEVMLDRRHAGFDHGGIAESLTDSPVHIVRFRLVLESSSLSQAIESDAALTYNTLQLSLLVQHPVTAYTGVRMEKSVEFVSQSFPCSIHLLNLRSLGGQPTGSHTRPPLTNPSFALVLHRPQVSQSAFPTSSCQLGIEPLLQTVGTFRVERYSLSLLHSREHMKDSIIKISQNEIHTYNITLGAT